MTDLALVKKLHLQAGRALVLNAPEAVLRRIQPPPAGVTLHTTSDGSLYDFVLLFAQDSADLASLAALVMSVLGPDCVFWACYPKKSSGVVTDLTRDEGWAPIYAAGYRGVASISIDDVWSAIRFRPQPSDEDLLAAQYKGKKAALRPIYDRLVAAIQALGPDVQLSVRKSYVAFARDKQFCLVKASTAKRIDLGLKLADAPASPRLEGAPSFGSGSITHKVALTTPEDVDDEVIAWLHRAYNGE